MAKSLRVDVNEGEGHGNAYVPKNFTAIKGPCDFHYSSKRDQELWLIRMPDSVSLPKDFTLQLDGNGNIESDVELPGGKKLKISQVSCKPDIVPVMSDINGDTAIASKNYRKFKRVLSVTTNGSTESLLGDANAVNVVPNASPAVVDFSLLKYRMQPFGVPAKRKYSSVSAKPVTEAEAKDEKKSEVKEATPEKKKRKKATK